MSFAELNIGPIIVTFIFFLRYSYLFVIKGAIGRQGYSQALELTFAIAISGIIIANVVNTLPTFSGQSGISCRRISSVLLDCNGWPFFGEYATSIAESITEVIATIYSGSSIFAPILCNYFVAKRLIETDFMVSPRDVFSAAMAGIGAYIFLARPDLIIGLCNKILQSASPLSFRTELGQTRLSELSTIILDYRKWALTTDGWIGISASGLALLTSVFLFSTILFIGSMAALLYQSLIYVFIPIAIIEGLFSRGSYFYPAWSKAFSYAKLSYLGVGVWIILSFYNSPPIIETIDGAMIPTGSPWAVAGRVFLYFALLLLFYISLFFLVKQRKAGP